MDWLQSIVVELSRALNMKGRFTDKEREAPIPLSK